jgi:uncharacterized protein YeaO (DUF488 family)
MGAPGASAAYAHADSEARFLPVPYTMIRVVRLGSPRLPDEGIRLGTVRRPPRGVRKEDFTKRDFFDVWMPELAPSAPLVSWALRQPFDPARWARYERAYRMEMKKPSAQRLISLLVAISKDSNVSIGCYCADESKCHRSILKDLLLQAGAEIP